MRVPLPLRALLLLAVVVAGGGGCDGAATGAVDAAVAPLDDGCGATPSAAWIEALRARARATPGALVAPGRPLADLRAPLDDDPAAAALVARARAQLDDPDPELAPGDAETLQAVASRALAAALLAWHDLDFTMAERARGLVAAAGIDEAWLAGAEEIAIRVGGALVALAGAVDLLAAVLPEAEVAAARGDVGRAARALDAWARAGGAALLFATANHHTVRLGAGLVAAGLVTAPADLDDEAVAYGLAQLSSTLHDSAGGHGAGWAEGPTYLAYGLEVAAPVLTALVPAWPLEGRGCLACPGHALAPCTEARVLAVLPSGDEVLRGVIEWLASLETQGGWFAPVDDSRLGGVPAPLLEQLAGVRLFRAWDPGGPAGSLGASVDVGPFVALALAAPAPARLVVPAAVWPQAGSARVEVVGGDGSVLEAFLFAEGSLAIRGRGHERPDPLSLVLAVDGRFLLGASGYGAYDERAPLARADASSLITVDGRLPFDEGLTTPGPAAAMLVVDGGAQGQLALPDVDVIRAVSVHGSELVVTDLVQLAAPHEIAWHWHLRGEVVAGPDSGGWTWRRDGRRCVALQTGAPEPFATVLETAPHVDEYGAAEEHPVVRQRGALLAGDYSLVTLVACAAE